MTRQRITQLDADTGEQLNGIIVYIGAKPFNIYGNDWYMGNRDASATLAKDPEITGRTFRVLHLMLSKLDFENWIQIPQKEIAEELGIRQSHVSKEIGILLRKKILARGPKEGRSYALRLNPYYAWRGNGKKAYEYQLELVKGGRKSPT